jgi:xylulokinase
VGTSSWLSCHVPFKRTDIFSNITSLPSGIPGRYWSATEQDVAGKAMSWLIEAILWADDEVSGPPPADALERVNVLAARAAPGAGGLFFTPWLNGERTPVDDHWIRGGWLNASLTTGRAELARSVFEGVALNSRWMLQAVEKFIKQPVGPIAFVGGGAQSDLWCQIHADVLGRPVRQVADPILANVRGAGIAAAVAMGWTTWDKVPSMVEHKAVYEPTSSNRATYDLLFESFTRTYKGTRRMYASLNQRLEAAHS